MRDRQVLLYFAWSRPAETRAPLAVIDDRFPAVFELLSDQRQIDHNSSESGMRSTGWTFSRGKKSI
jgi:hypothetical protein